MGSVPVNGGVPKKNHQIQIFEKKKLLNLTS